ncbi:MAG: hypothetical protein OEW12_05215 [Deltaproteobacteria bacterium]|nr:hypothetical protein [Deltaproteobacteria bacterium]
MENKDNKVVPWPKGNKKTGSLAKTADLLGLPFLMDSLKNPSDQVKMWAAYQLVDRWQERAEEFLDLMWESDLKEIREPAINLVGKLRLERFGFPLLRQFTSGEESLKGAAGVALGHLKYKTAEKSLVTWLDEVLTNEDSPLADKEAAAESLLVFDNHAYWGRVMTHTMAHLQNHTMFAPLFRLLCRHAETPQQAGEIARMYKTPREVFHDVHLTQPLIDMVGMAHLGRYLQTRLTNSQTLAQAYREALTLLEVDCSGPMARELLAALDECDSSAGGVARLMEILPRWIEFLAPGHPDSEKILSFLLHSRDWVNAWDEAILKVRDLEFHFLATLPLAAGLKRVEAECTQDPQTQALQIANLYQSSLLSPGFMRQVLALLAHNGQARGRLEPLPIHHGWLWDDEKEALWKLFTHQLDGSDYPFEKVLPQPWVYRIPELNRDLAAAMEKRLPFYLSSSRTEAVDYAMEVLQRAGSVGVVGLLTSRFDLLLNQHYHGFLDFMTHVPDVRFLPMLQGYYKPGEYDLARLIYFISDVHGLPRPELEDPLPEKGPGSAYPTARLACPDCGSAYQYTLEPLYVDAECLEQRLVPAPQHLWLHDPLRCKNCEGELPLFPDNQFLQDLYTELLALRTLNLTRKESAPLGGIHIIHFPQLDGRTLNPALFLQKVREELDQARSSTPPRLDREAECRFELGRFHLETGRMDEAKLVFEEILTSGVKYPAALYYLGVIAFQERNLYQARVYFSRLIQTASREDFGKELDNPVDMAQHYLKLLDKREFKRSYFHIVT